MRGMQCNVGLCTVAVLVCMVLCADSSLGVDRETQFGISSPGTSKPDVCPELMGRRHKLSRYMQDLK